MAAAAAPVASMVRLVESIIGALLHLDPHNGFLYRG